MLEQGPRQAVKTPSLEMFTAQLDIGPSATWPKFDVGLDLEIGPALSRVLDQMISGDAIQHQVFKKSKMFFEKK